MLAMPGLPAPHVRLRPELRRQAHPAGRLRPGRKPAEPRRSSRTSGRPNTSTSSTSLGRPREIDRLMGDEKVRAALVIPRDFSEDLAGRAGAPRSRSSWTAPTPSSATTAAGYVGGHRPELFARGSTRRRSSDRGLKALRSPALATDVRVWYNPELRSAIFLVPGLMAFILMVIVVVSTAFSIVREKERGTMEQILVSPRQPAGAHRRQDRALRLDLPRLGPPRPSPRLGPLRRRRSRATISSFS